MCLPLLSHRPISETTGSGRFQSLGMAPWSRRQEHIFGPRNENRVGPWLSPFVPGYLGALMSPTDSEWNRTDWSAAVVNWRLTKDTGTVLVSPGSGAGQTWLVLGSPGSETGQTRTVLVSPGSGIGLTRTVLVSPGSGAGQTRTVLLMVQ